MKRNTILTQVLSAQRNEISEYYTYTRLAKLTKNEQNQKTLERIANEEYEHYQIFKGITNSDVKPRKLRILFFYFISVFFGLSFGLRLMERGEDVAQRLYTDLKSEIPEMADIILDEQKHENDILNLLEDERIEYAGSIVLGLNDALMELTGVLAGLTFAFQNTRFIAMAGFITGVAASMSMAASEFLSSREETDMKDDNKNPLKSAAYTGIAYIITVLILISPYMLFTGVYTALGAMILLSLLIIFKR